MNSRFHSLGVEAALWLLTICGLATGIGIETDWGRQWKLPNVVFANRPITFTKPDLSEPFQLAPADTFIEIAMRPLFVATRRPSPAPPPPAPPKPTMHKGQFELTGVSIVAGSKFVFLIEKAGNRRRVVSEGNELNGIRVKEVTANQVVLTQYDDVEVLVLKTANGPLKP